MTKVKESGETLCYFYKIKQKLMLLYLDHSMYLVLECQKMIIEYFQDFFHQSKIVDQLQFLKMVNKLGHFVMFQMRSLQCF